MVLFDGSSHFFDRIVESIRIVRLVYIGVFSVRPSTTTQCPDVPPPHSRPHCPHCPLSRPTPPPSGPSRLSSSFSLPSWSVSNDGLRPPYRLRVPTPSLLTRPPTTLGRLTPLYLGQGPSCPLSHSTAHPTNPPNTPPTPMSRIPTIATPMRWISTTPDSHDAANPSSPTVDGKPVMRCDPNPAKPVAHTNTSQDTTG